MGNFKQLKSNHTDSMNLDIEVSGIPFSVTLQNGAYANISPGSFDIQTKSSVLFFLGMVTELSDGSDRWGMSDKLYSFSNRLFIGDRLGRIVIKFSDGTQINVPVIFGVNIWPYELFWGLNENDSRITAKGGAVEAGPFNEPFGSDLSAANLLENSLILNKAGNTKHTKYIFALSLGNKQIQRIDLIDERNKSAGFVISAITSYDETYNKNIPDKFERVEKTEVEEMFVGIRIFEYEYFYNQKYVVPMRKLAHRLYQFKEDIPNEISIDNPYDNNSMRLVFEGNKFASIMSNVFHHNIGDMVNCKIDDDGQMHTSSFEAPSFGRYVGFGSFKEKDGAYYKQIWGRDVGRLLIELVELGESSRTINCVDKLFEYLYDSGLKYKAPNWKRVINGSIVAQNQQMNFWSGRENDGHGLIMLFLSDLVLNGYLDNKYIELNWHHFVAAVEWYIWQINNPGVSNFDGTFYSDSEPAGGGGYDLYSNYISYKAIDEFAKIALKFNRTENHSSWKQISRTLFSEIIKKFTIKDNVRGNIYTDNYIGFDSWSLGYKIFAPIMIEADCSTYDIYGTNRELFNLSSNTYYELKKEYKSNAYGRIMGYCQAFAFQTALLLDDYDDITQLAESTSMMCYHNYDHSYIVPEGVIMHPSGEYWYRNGDLGNAVQQAEIIKCIRIMTGLDKFDFIGGIKLIPRLPNNWNKISVTDFKICLPKEITNITSKSECTEEYEITGINFKYNRISEGYEIKFDSSKPVKINYLRVGPFSTPDCGNLNLEISDFNLTNTDFYIDTIYCINDKYFLNAKPKGQLNTNIHLAITLNKNKKI